MVLIGAFGYNQIQSLLFEREKEVLEESLNQSVQHINDKLQGYNNSLNYILINESLKRELNQTFLTNYDMYLFYRDILNPLFINTLALNRDFDQITLYTDIKINNHGRFLRSLREIETLPWYSRFNESPFALYHLSPDRSKINIAAELFTQNHNTRSIVNIAIDYNTLFNPLYNIYEDSFGIFIKQGDDVLLGYQKEENKTYNYINTGSMPNIKQTSQFKSNYIMQQSRIPTTGWEITLIRPTYVINQPLQTITMTFIGVLIVSFMLSISLSFLLARRIITPIEALANNMKAIHSNNFNITVKANSKDEISTLIQTFKKMVKRIDHLVNQVYQEKLQTKDYELKALQAQINPHFFYNALSLINSKAIVAEQEEISHVTQYLSTFYRTSLNKGKSFLPLSEEISNAKAYLDIQQMMHNQSFDYYIHVPKELGHISVPNLIIQPLIENAIQHGIDMIEGDKQGLIVIDGRIQDNIIELIISDNGPGMMEDTVKYILEKKSDGYGVRNVHKRIQLYFGKDYGLSYSSLEKKGTVVTIRLPYTHNERY